jgi:hypothetical protein
MQFCLKPTPTGLLLLLFPEGEEFTDEELRLLEPHGGRPGLRELSLSFHHGEEGELTRLLGELGRSTTLRYFPL